MNILVVSSSGLYNYYSSSFVHNQAKEYVKLGHRVRVLVPLAIGKSYDGGSRFSAPVTVVHQDGVEVCYVRNLSLSNFGEPKFNHAMAKASIQLLWHWIFSDFKPDVIHTHTISLGVVGLFLKKKLGIPLVITTHGGDTDVAIQKENLDEAKCILDQADAVIAVSSAYAKKTMQIGATTQIGCILNGFVISNVQQMTKVPRRIVQAGYLVERKHAELTIQATAKLREKYPDISLVLVGDGPQRGPFDALCNQLEISDCVQFLGHCSNADTLAEMGKAEFFCMPSVLEGFGIVYLEAMASGCVTIGTEGEGIADLIISGRNGFLVPPNDVDAIVKVVDWCVVHPDEAAAIAERGRHDALELTWAKNARQYIELFNNLKGNT